MEGFQINCIRECCIFALFCRLRFNTVLLYHLGQRYFFPSNSIFFGILNVSTNFYALLSAFDFDLSF